MSQGLDPDDFRDFAAIGLGWSIVGVLVFFIIGGLLLDRYLGTTPWLMLTGVGLGLVSAGWLLYELTLINRTDRRAGPVGRRLERRKGGKHTGKDNGVQ